MLPVLEAVARAMEKIYARDEIAVAVTEPDDLAFCGEQHDLEEMLGNLVDNACKCAEGEVALSAEALSEAISGSSKFVSRSMMTGQVFRW